MTWYLMDFVCLLCEGHRFFTWRKEQWSTLGSFCVLLQVHFTTFSALLRRLICAPSKWEEDFAGDGRKGVHLAGYFELSTFQGEGWYVPSAFSLCVPP